MMVIYRTQANPNYLDLTLDPSERAVGSIFSPRPDLFNYHAFGLAHVVDAGGLAVDLVRALVVRANLIRNLPEVTVPTLVVGANGRPGHLRRRRARRARASGAADKQLEFIEGADHFMRAGGSRAHLGDPRPRLMKLLSGWARERFAP